MEDGSPWQAMNITQLKTTGFEINLNSNLNFIFPHQPINSISFKYTYLDSDYDSGDFTSRYLLKYLQHQGIIAINHNLVWDIKTDWYFRYENRYNSESNFITDLGVGKSFNNIKVFVKATNLFDVDYFDFVGVPLPGRWVVGGIKLSLN